MSVSAKYHWVEMTPYVFMLVVFGQLSEILFVVFIVIDGNIYLIFLNMNQPSKKSINLNITQIIMQTLINQHFVSM